MNSLELTNKFSNTSKNIKNENKKIKKYYPV